MDTIKIVIADDHPTFREGLCRLIDEVEDLHCIGQASDGFEALKMVKELEPDVVILDVSMPGTNGIETAKRIKFACPKTAILMLSAFDFQSYILSALQVGASGYMSKDRPFTEIAGAIRLAKTGNSVFDFKATDRILNNIIFSDNGNEHNQANLNTREMDVIKLTAQGMSNKQIATTLMLSERTVQTHLVNIYKKLKVNSRTQAILSGLREGWLSIDNLT